MGLERPTVWMAHTLVYLPAWLAIRDASFPFQPYPIPAEMAGTYGYLEFFEARWADRLEWVNLEHDVIATAHQLHQFMVCPEPWCCFNEYDGGPPTLSLARFRPQFMAEHAGIWDDLRAAHRISVFQPLWCRLDSWLVERAGPPCVHTQPHVVNVRPGGSLH